MFPPILFLLAMVGLTVAAAALAAAARRRRAAVLSRLATDWGMRYLADDGFDLAPHVARHLGVPGAASVFVRDLVFTREGRRYVYLFTLEYTTGVLRTKRRRIAVGGLTETAPADGVGLSTFSPVLLAPAGGRAESYGWVRERLTNGTPGSGEPRAPAGGSTRAGAAPAPAPREG